MLLGEAWSAADEHARKVCDPETCVVCAFVRQTRDGILAEQDRALSRALYRPRLRLIEGGK